MFEVGQKIELLDVEALRFDDSYKSGDVFVVGDLTPSGYAVDSNYKWCLTKDDINKGYARILTEELKPRDLACFDQVASVIGEDKAEQELQVVIDGGFYQGVDQLQKETLGLAFAWIDTPQGVMFWGNIDEGRNPYSRIDIIGQNGNDGEHYNELSEASKRITERSLIDPIEFVAVSNESQQALDEVHGDSLIKKEATMKQRTPAHELLEAGSKHMKDRASARDTGEERSMKSCVNAFNAMYADIIRANNGNLTEELGWMFMVFLKASRAKGGDYRQDDYVDGAAYFALAGETASVDRQ